MGASSDFVATVGPFLIADHSFGTRLPNRETPVSTSSATDGAHAVDRGAWRLELDSAGGLRIWHRPSLTVWEQANGVAPTDVSSTSEGLRCGLSLVDDGGTAHELIWSLGLSESGELTVELSGSPEETIGELAFPGPFFLRSAPGYYVLPLAEGVLASIDDPELAGRRLEPYAWYGLLMPWVGMTDLERGYLAILETPWDVAVDMRPKATRGGALLSGAQPVWLPEHGRLSYPRRLRYVFTLDGGYVAIAKRYRAYVQATGRWKDMREKVEENPEAAKLGGPFLWIQTENDQVEAVRALHERGLANAVVYRYAPPEIVEAFRSLDYLVGKYNNFVDLYPADEQRVDSYEWRNIWVPLGMKEGFPQDAIVNHDGSLMYGWPLRRDGFWLPNSTRDEWGTRRTEWTYHGLRDQVNCYRRCSQLGLPLARTLLPAERDRYRYSAMLIDVKAALPLFECWSDQHPLSRRQDMENRQQLLSLSRELGLVTGSEKGADWAVPYADYFEGTTTLWIHPNGQALQDFPPSPHYIRKNLDPGRRVPLYQLVYHDAVVTTWWWGDGNFRPEALWDVKDAFNLLYANAPILIADDIQLLGERADRIIQTYRHVCELARRLMYEEMTDHRWCTPDREVQETHFSSGARVVVNFGDLPYSVDQGGRRYLLGPYGYLAAGDGWLQGRCLDNGQAVNVGAAAS